VADLSWDTATMAELYFKQGHPEQAIDVYRRVIAREPGNTRAAQRLREIEQSLNAQRGQPMTFREHIQRIVQSTPGAVACTIMGFDGIAIDTFETGTGEVDIPVLLVEFAAAAQLLRRNATQSPAGGFVEMVVTNQHLSAIVRPLTEEYFLAVVLAPNALVGKARFLMRVAAAPIAKELS
jgi:predicted regulator of Ras-like GTPase activity (Roadblock/LC7/MglB family)